MGEPIRYGDRVRVIEGFHKGRTGKAIAENPISGIYVDFGKGLPVEFPLNMLEKVL